jgi:hypothetical protein
MTATPERRRARHPAFACARTALEGSLRVAGLVGLLAALPVVALGQSAEPPPDLSPAERLAFTKQHARPRLMPLTGPRGDARQDDFDVIDYELSLGVDVFGQSLFGTCVVTFEPSADATPVPELVLDFDAGMGLMTVVGPRGEDLTPVTRREGDLVVVPLDPPATSRVRVTLGFAGQPAPGGLGTFVFGTDTASGLPTVFSASEPYRARGWWPCKDRPDDKATLTVHVDAPDSLVAVSNGRLVAREPSTGGRLLTTWREEHPIATYLVSVALASYEQWDETFTSPRSSLTMSVMSWSFPSRAEMARLEWGPTVDMLDYFTEAFGEYPFIDEKYGHAMVQLGAAATAIEHQTATSYNAANLSFDGRFMDIVSHELAHSWFGNSAGVTSFSDNWLKEGFATYAEALWREQRYGRAEYLRYVNRSLDFVNSYGDFCGTVVDPPDCQEAQDGGVPDGEPDILGRTVYFKGAWVLHMLRWVYEQLPPPAPWPDRILEVLRTHAASHAYGVATTGDFIATADAAARNWETDPTPLSQWFFPQWLEREGRPSYEVGWSLLPELTPAGDHSVVMRVRQVQPEPYRMPALVRISLADGGRYERVVMVEGPEADFRFDVPGAGPVRLTFDEDGWILKRLATIDIDRDDDGWPDWMDGCPDVPNPRQEDLDAEGGQDACQAGIDFDGDERLNEVDCAPADVQAWALPEGQASLRVSKTPAPAAVLEMQLPAERVGERPYVADIGWGSLKDLRCSDPAGDPTCVRGYDRLACRIRGHAMATLTDPAPTRPGGTYWLVFTANACGGAPTPEGASDPCP